MICPVAAGTGRFEVFYFLLKKPNIGVVLKGNHLSSSIILILAENRSPNSFFMTNPEFVAHLRTGGYATNHLLHIPSPWTAEVAGLAGYDSVTIDMQHGLMDLQQTIGMLQALSATHTPAIVRIPWNDPAMAMKILDAGAAGVLCPMVDTVQQAEAFVQACRYPPHGFRSFGPIRAGLRHGRSYFEQADDFHLRFVMIETREALENLEDIAQVEGLDGLFVGPSDLSISMGWPKGDLTNPKMQAALRKVVDVCQRFSRIPVIFTTTLEEARLVSPMGFQLQSFQTDSGLLQQIHQQQALALKRILPSAMDKG
jgi:4-hydroxy-2-oxoheptanedioate aldolase